MKAGLNLYVLSNLNKICKCNKIRQWRITNCSFEVWLNITLKNNTIICKKLATIVSGQKNVALPFVRRKQVSTCAKCNSDVHCCFGICFLLKKVCATYFWPEAIVATFLHLMLLLFKVIFNHTWKRQFVVLYCHIRNKHLTFGFFIYLLWR